MIVHEIPEIQGEPCPFMCLVDVIKLLKEFTT
jgi:hypothetical protein